MQSDEARYIKKRVKSGTIDVHPTEKALIVNYELEAIILGENGQPMIGDKKECQKTIRLKSLDSNTNCKLLAREVVSKCNLIHPSKTPEVEHLIYYLQSRKNNAFSKNNLQPVQTPISDTNPLTFGSSVPPGEKASFTNIEEYIELLYDDMADKIKGASLILQLAKDSNNLEELSRSETVLSALSRVLREDWKKNIDLSTNIIHVFFCFSLYNQFHSIILQYKIGSICIEIIDHELKRYYDWKNKLENASKGPPPPSRLPVRRSASVTRMKSQIPVGISYSASHNSRRHSELGLATPAQPRRPASMMTTSLVGGEDERIVQSRLKFQTLVSKQDHLLKASLHLLMNIAENPKVEDKVRKRNIVAHLVSCVDRQNKDLLLVVLQFLRKLSVYYVNKEQMASLELVEKLPRLLMTEDGNIENSTLKLLFNLSFDTSLREKMVKTGFLPKLVSLLEEGKHHKVIIRLLYNLSVDDRVKAMFAYTNCMTLLTNLLLEDHDNESERDNVLVALCINLALNSRNAELMLKNRQLELLMIQAFSHKDVLLLKVIRNMSTHSNVKHYFVDYIGDFANCVSKEKDEAFKLECLGILGNLIIPDLDYFHLLEKYDLHNLILKWLQTRSLPDDFLLELINFIGTTASDPISAEHFCKNGTVDLLINALKEMQEDDEIVLQILYVFYQICRHTICQDYLIKQTDAPAYMIDLLNDGNLRIQKVCDLALNIVQDCDKMWAERIQTQKFTFHNQQWLEMVENKNIALPAAMMSVSPSEADPLKNLLRNSVFFPSDPYLANGDDIEIVSNNPQSDENPSRPMSRLDVGDDVDDIDIEIMKMKLMQDSNNEAGGRNALKNVVIADENNLDSFVHIDSFNNSTNH